MPNIVDYCTQGCTILPDKHYTALQPSTVQHFTTKPVQQCKTTTVPTCTACTTFYNTLKTYTVCRLHAICCIPLDSAPYPGWQPTLRFGKLPSMGMRGTVMARGRSSSGAAGGQ